MKAVILAAGKSSRLYPLTLDKPKCLLELEEGKAIIDFQIEMLEKCGVNNVVVIVGYLQELIRKHLGDKADYLEFFDYEKYNNLYTLYSIRERLDDDVIILYSDVLFSKSLLEKCVKSKEDFCLLVHNREILRDSARVKIINNSIVDIGNHIKVEEGDGNFIGVAKYSKEGIRKLIEKSGKFIGKKEYDNSYYIVPLIELSKENKIGFEFANEEPWIEIDFLRDYEKAKSEVYPKLKFEILSI